MQLYWHRYKYYPYEKDLALREIKSLLDPAGIHAEGHTIHLDHPLHPELVNRLVYFANSTVAGGEPVATQQNLLERVNGNGVNRQSTRYSAHGLHEYKGKFNPQVAKAMLNIFGAHPGQLVLDPFCGSGTSLVECAHLGINSVGTDINPLAVFLATAKLKSLTIPAESLLNNAKFSLIAAKRLRTEPTLEGERGDYLKLWFPLEYLSDMERLRLAIDVNGGENTSVLLAIASNLLRDYSLQEPHDLRIRRRKSPFPDKSFFDAYEEAVRAFCTRLYDAQQTLGIIEAHSKAVNVDCKKAENHPDLRQGTFDLALTSPPYAMALPYIDTQRLSLVWLDLLCPSDILSLESELVGSREIRGKGKKALLEALEANDAMLPEQESALCIRLQNTLGENDGFRRQAVPRLLYRYFANMADAFFSVSQLVKPNAPFGLIVGGNHTVLNGKRFDINTPEHLARIATTRGWQHVETVSLQAYQRYGLHMNNATSTESLVILRAAT
ncbi:DNA methyltransferase [Nitrosovibrio sp. Nv6]|uniref:DNA methyltransferase n=1 Tax=Nitrosovibrio sp. Nv6 TaxID=1855340 RepID=UPI0008CFB9BB|nr:DNA methyltransferase [Nitrosovibrio sp. Nv6]SEP42527.1 site-specific DNA-methyltransferase (cytosine-N4-specific) [Nitrosovibrio sp. Nv6]